jgi:UTP--glucose-1-phosphate uridylyltransferase
MADHVAAALDKMRAAGAHPAELAAMTRRLEQLDDADAGRLSGDVLEPLDDLPLLDELPEPAPERAREVLDRLAVVKLNGGLGTSMGLSGPKSLLRSSAGAASGRDSDVVLALRERTARACRWLEMNPGHGCRRWRCCAHAGLRDQEVPLDLAGPRAEAAADDLQPRWSGRRTRTSSGPARHRGPQHTAPRRLRDAGDPARRGCADLRPNSTTSARSPTSGFAARRDERCVHVDRPCAGRRPTARVGTSPVATGWCCARRAGSDGARRRPSFGDVDRWRYYNSNNLVDLQALQDRRRRPLGAPVLPLIVNRKTVDPRDKTSPAVIQLETAMGAAVGSIPGARAVQVPRSRFAPVKTTNDLLVLRSDFYVLTEDVHVVPADGREPGSIFVDLDPDHYKLLRDFDARFPGGPPSLVRASRFVVRGDVTFGPDVAVEGETELESG